MKIDDDAVAGALRTTEAFLDRFNAGDAAGHAATLAYPHVRLASGRVRIWESADDAIPGLERAFPLLRDQGWDHSRWDHRNVIHESDEKVHLDVQFTRYRADDSALGVYSAVYVVVNQDGNWLIQCRSSFAP
jgi:hypothetical protein